MLAHVTALVAGIGTGYQGALLAVISAAVRKAVRLEIVRSAAKQGARDMRVFGSAARGESGANTDAGFTVAVQPEHSPWCPADLSVDLEDLLPCSEVQPHRTLCISYNPVVALLHSRTAIFIINVILT